MDEARASVVVSVRRITLSILPTVAVLPGTVMVTSASFSTHLSPTIPRPGATSRFIPPAAVTWKSVEGVPAGVAKTPFETSRLYGIFICSAL